jgi:hypothetical protein
MACQKKQKRKAIEDDDDKDNVVIESDPAKWLKEDNALDREWKILDIVFEEFADADIENFTQHYLSWVIFVTVLRHRLRRQFSMESILDEMEERYMKLLCYCSPRHVWGISFQIQSAQQRSFKMKSLFAEWTEMLFGPEAVMEARITVPHGIGLFSRKDNSVMISSSIVGFNLHLHAHVIKRLVELRYPSILSGNLLLYGPLSLVNHSCQSENVLKSTRLLRKVSPGIEEESLTENFGFNVGEEITVFYSDNVPFLCSCAECLLTK